MASVLAPPYDQIGPETQARLYEMSPWNIVRLTLPREGYAAARATLDAWRGAGIFEREREPAIYPYQQVYVADGAPVTRRGRSSSPTSGPTPVPRRTGCGCSRRPRPIWASSSC